MVSGDNGRKLHVEKAELLLEGVPYEMSTLTRCCIFSIKQPGASGW
jgi:hypothetical protein